MLRFRRARAEAARQPELRGAARLRCRGSELFGHVRGAFSGASSDRRGKFQLADGGTLFLDEVGELSLAVQASCCACCRTASVQRLGSDREHAVDVRLIAASNRDLAEEVRAKAGLRADFITG